MWKAEAAVGRRAHGLQVQYLQLSWASGAEFSSCRCSRQWGMCWSMIVLKRSLIPTQVHPIPQRRGIRPVLGPPRPQPPDRHHPRHLPYRPHHEATRPVNRARFEGPGEEVHQCQVSARSPVKSVTCCCAGRSPRTHISRLPEAGPVCCGVMERCAGSRPGSNLAFANPLVSVRV